MRGSAEQLLRCRRDNRCWIRQGNGNRHALSNQAGAGAAECKRRRIVQQFVDAVNQIRFFIPPGSADDQADAEGTPAEGFVELLKQSGDREESTARAILFE